MIDLDTLKRMLEADYDSYSHDSNRETLKKWGSYLDKFPDKVDFCVSVLLNKEKEKQYGVLQPTQMHRSSSELFLRDTANNLTVEILLHVLKKEDDEKYFEARQKHAEAIHKKLTDLNLLEVHLSDDELAAPNDIEDQQTRINVEELNKFLANLRHPILQSQRLGILLRHLSSIDLANINWVDKIFVLLSSSNKRNYMEQEKSSQKTETPVDRFLQPNEATKKELVFLLEYQKLKTRYPENDEAEKRFARFFLWHCKKEDLDAAAAARRYHSFLRRHGLYPAFTNYLDVATQYPPIKTGMYSEDFCAQTEDSATVVTHQGLPFGEDMSQDEKHNLLLKLNVTCCFANQSGIKIKTTGTDQVFFVARDKNSNTRLFTTKFAPPIQGMELDGINPEKEMFVILVSGNAPISTEEVKALLTKYPLPTKALSEKLAQEISTENGKAPIAVSILPIDRNSKKLQYAAHIPKNAQGFQQRLEALPDFDRYKKLKEEVEQLIQKTERYFAKLNDEVESEKESFISSHQGSSVIYRYKDWELTNLEISGVNDEEKTIFENTIGEKSKLRYEVSQSLKKLKSNDKTALEKIQEFSQNLFTVEAAAEPVDAAQDVAIAEPIAAAQAAIAKPSLAKRIENTKTGFDYLKDIVSIIASGVAFISLVGIIPMIAYRYKAHKWLWESNRGNFLDEAKTAQEMQTTFPRAPVAAA